MLIDALDGHPIYAWSTLNWLIDISTDTWLTLKQQLADSRRSATQLIIEGLLCKKGLYQILADFHFLQDRASIWQTDLFWHEKHRAVIVSIDLHFVLQKKKKKKDSVLREAAS